MAHFAELNENNIVLRVVVVNDQYEKFGESWCHDFFGGRWIQTSYNNRIRKRFAGIGFTYNETLDAFIRPKPFDSWVLNTQSSDWESPIPKPNNNYRYEWVESLQNWIRRDAPLLKAFGATQEYAKIKKTVEKYNLKERQITLILDRPDYKIYFQKIENVLVNHVSVTKWSKEIAKSYLEDINILHREIDTEIYSLNFKCNAELKNDKLPKFLEISGCQFLRNEVLEDGYQHYLYVRHVPTEIGLNLG